MNDDLISRAGLLPCPFCGADAKLRGGPLAQETYSIWCSGRPSHHQDYGFDAEKAIAAWNTRALPAAQVQAEPVAQEPVAWRVYSMMRQGAPNNVKARGIGSDPTEYLYPAHREADARECARLMRGEVQPLYSHPATTPPAPGRST